MMIRQVRNAVLGAFLVASGTVFSSVPVEFHAHEFSISGVLPEPYRTLKVHIRLDERTDDVVEFRVNRGGQPILIPAKIMEQLVAVELGTIEISHGMHRSQEDPVTSMFGGEGDWLHISFDSGRKYRADRVSSGRQEYQWGRDRITVTITKNEEVTIQLGTLADRHSGWRERTWK